MVCLLTCLVLLVKGFCFVFNIGWLIGPGFGFQFLFLLSDNLFCFETGLST